MKHARYETISYAIRCYAPAGLLHFFQSFSFAQCGSGQSLVEITINPDNYPQEITWDLVAGGNTVAAGTSNDATVCVPAGSCMVFTIHDSYGDGICCNYGTGSYGIKLNGTVIGYGGQFTQSESTIVGCGPGTYCENPLPLTTGPETAFQNNTYYEFECAETECILLRPAECPTAIQRSGYTDNVARNPQRKRTQDLIFQ